MTESTTNQFGRQLAAFRERANMTQQHLANRCGVSQSFIAQLERVDRRRKNGDERVNNLSHTQVTKLVEALDLWPPDFDELYRLAGLSTDRTREEEITLQSSYHCRSLWVFARSILDIESDFFKVVAANMRRQPAPVSYTYFIPRMNEIEFEMLHRKLVTLGEFTEQELSNPINHPLTCYCLPEALFISNFAIYNPPIEVQPGTNKCKGSCPIYGCGTKSINGKAQSFFTLHITEVITLYERILGWKNRIDLGSEVLSQSAYKLFPKHT
ncbi:MAG: helix-turn-helix transcriptional regulator [Patescibacteria group bacterium]